MHFTNQAAGRILRFHQGTYWGALDSELYWCIFAAGTSLSCELCGAPSHPVTACTVAKFWHLAHTLLPLATTQRLTVRERGQASTTPLITLILSSRYPFLFNQLRTSLLSYLGTLPSKTEPPLWVSYAWSSYPARRIRRHPYSSTTLPLYIHFTFRIFIQPLNDTLLWRGPH